MNSSEPVRHFSMIRDFHLADLFTIANGFCGVAAVFQAVQYASTHVPRHIYLAALLIPVAMVLDFFDGRVARWRHQFSPMGREMDSLADVVSFGVAPATIAFAAGLSSALDQLILMFFAGCGLSRLARYNVTAEKLAGPSGKVNYYEGTPITFSMIPLGALLLAFWHGSLYPVDIMAGVEIHLPSILFAVSGSLMISKTIHVPKP